MINLPCALQSLHTKNLARQLEKEYQQQENNFKLIWGIKSSDDQTDGVASIYTMNDIDITYDKRAKTYSLNIETIYKFESGSDGERGYMLNLFDEMTIWMKAQGYNTEINPWIYDIFTAGKNVTTDFKSIEELYTTFKCLVKGFC